MSKELFLRGVKSIYLVVYLIYLSCVLSIPERSNTGIRGPPLITKQKPHGGGGSENGIRQISKDECLKYINKWYQTTSVSSGAMAIEKLEMLMELERLTQEMPGKKPSRLEYIAFGLFSDGLLETVTGIAWQKLTLPNEMAIITLCDKNTRAEYTLNILRFIDNLCKENAIIPDHSRLERYEMFDSSLISLGRKKSEIDISSTRLEELRNEYKRHNRVGICLDEVPSDSSIYRKGYLELDLGHYWYRYSIKTKDIEIPFYFRQKKGRFAEYEVIFSRPEAGAVYGSGTVGGPRIISLDSQDIEKNANLRNNILSLADDIRAKIVDPPCLR